MLDPVFNQKLTWAYSTHSMLMTVHIVTGGSDDVLAFPPPLPTAAFLKDASPSSLGSFLLDVWQVSCVFLCDFLWLAGGSHGETTIKANCIAGAHEARLWEQAHTGFHDPLADYGAGLSPPPQSF